MRANLIKPILVDGAAKVNIKQAGNELKDAEPTTDPGRREGLGGILGPLLFTERLSHSCDQVHLPGCDGAAEETSQLNGAHLDEGGDALGRKEELEAAVPAQERKTRD